ncbi:hypothetical protein [Mucilaginibacter myungsuensis]|uniref:Uncharacterized protein n=1 Tax=Mucilaginibacter myungsuensis TaxID=649104 RepID=A0A929L340_9SPHI|nr:hypothetical protein [Mucilaginibacter myungsuensis]MBE9662356.1 hypothetical protein [Mucilaginibacter myungsuensis]MDN3599207.1 hypothetical protein [Mucilaginibacter myungsuensis]
MPAKPIITQHPDRTEVIIPPDPNWLIMLVVVFILAFWWISGGVIAIRAIIDSRELDANDWVWATWGIAVMLILLRYIWAAITGTERIIFTFGSMSVKRSLLSSAEVYDLPKIRRFEVIEMDENYSVFDGRLPDADGKGTIRFRYLDKYVRIGYGLSLSAAERLVKDLAERNIVTDKNF